MKELEDAIAGIKTLGVTSNTSTPNKTLAMEFDINAPLSKAKDTLIHLALSQNRIDLVEYVLKRYDNEIHVNVPNEQGVTPLMVAVVSCPRAIQSLLTRGADPRIRAWKHRKTAFDLAPTEEIKQLLLNNSNSNNNSTLGCDHNHNNDMGFTSMADTTNPSALSKGATSCNTTTCSCPFCGVVLKARTRLDYVLKESSCDNVYVQQFIATDACRIIATDPAYHVLTSKRHLKKEISESWAVLTAVEETMNLDDHVTLVDLCAGSSLTTTIFGLMHPCSKGLAVDRMNDQFVPHFHGNLSYLQGDIMDDQFMTQHLEERLQHDNAAVLVGMHLCGDLSIRAIELFIQMPQFKAIVLSPCCFPKSKNGNSRMDALSMKALVTIKDEEEKYVAWSNYLQQSLAKHCSKCFSKKDANILSCRNRIVVGCR